jgi:GT2 family glycosyltransferase
MQFKVGVVIPTFKRPQELRRCIESLKNHSVTEFSIVVINDSSDIKVSKVIQSFPYAIEIASKTDLWWTKSVNLGLKYFLDKNFDAVIILNDDVILEKDYIDNMINFFARNRNSIVVSKVINQAGKVWSIGGDVSWPFIGEYHIPFDDRSLHQIKWAPGMGTLIPIEVLKKVGFFDEFSMPQYLSDADYGLRATRKGVRLILNESSVVRNNTNLTGGLQSKNKLSLNDLKFIFFDFRSPDYIKARTVFIFRYAPLGLKLLSLLIRILKIIFYFAKRLL